jgi:uncharacterized protein (DUF305 family)
VHSAVSRGIVLLAVAVLLTGCTNASEPPAPASTAPVVQLGAPGEPNRTLSPEEQAALDLTIEHVEADVVFVRDMLHHHAQALVMTGYVDERADSDDIRLLAQRMDISQTAEMEQLERWLQDRGEPVRDPDAAHADHSGMPGLLTEDEIAKLEASEGEEFDRLFLEYMIRHHEGAVDMVHDLDDAGGGVEIAIGDIARHVEADQNIEIARMQEMLAAME